MHEFSHRRKNILTGEWVQVSPHRNKRPWQGKVELVAISSPLKHDKNCYLCPGNVRNNGSKNPDYSSVYVFENDFPALQYEVENESINEHDLFIARAEKGICRVICFSPNHSLTLAQMDVNDIKKVVDAWQQQYVELGNLPDINYVQIFENKGEMMGCSNPHPHGQIWAQNSIPMEPLKEDENQRSYFQSHGKSLLQNYLQAELEKKERWVCQNNHFAALVPYWAVWPFETIIIPRKHIQHMGQMNEEEKLAFAQIIRDLTIRYDNLFQTSFPYSAGIHQSPTNGQNNEHWHMHMHFYPPLLRSATVKKFMVGYEMLGNPQRDVTPESAAEMLRNLPEKHYLNPDK
jgi:UDPglucose--hexose-1-phosphate uridylyltransferase